MRRAVLAAFALLGCGGEVTPPGPTVNLFPVALNNRWVYRVTEPGKAESTKIQTITNTATVGFVFTTDNGNKQTVSVQALDGTKLVRSSESTSKDGIVEERLLFEPPALRLDTAVGRLGATYTSEHVEKYVDARGNVIATGIAKTQSFRVEADAEMITVPAGTFSSVKIVRTSNNEVVKTFWYADGVGKIKEEGGQTEELVRYEVEEP